MCNVRGNLNFVSRIDSAVGGIFYQVSHWHHDVLIQQFLQKRTLTQWKPRGYHVGPPVQQVAGGTTNLRGSVSCQMRHSSGWKDSHIDFELDMEQSVKRGTPIPQITKDVVCWHSVLGRRTENEDRVSVNKINDNTLYVGIFDGHGSTYAVDFVVEHLPKQLESWLKYNRNIQVCLKQSFVDVNNLYSRKMWSLMSRSQHSQEEANLFYQGMKSGTTAIAAVLRNSQELVVGSIGDSCAIICRDGIAHSLSTNHVPETTSEQQRIQTRGGFIASNSIGQLLVNGRLSMTRSLGDLQLQWNGVIPIPSTISVEVKHHKDHFLLLVTDGISQVISEQEMVNIVLSCSHPQEACRFLTDIALQYGSDDNSTAIILPLGAWGRGSPKVKGLKYFSKDEQFDVRTLQNRKD